MKKDNKGFTLIELIVVVLIIAIIAVAMTPQVTKWVKKSREAMDTNNAGTIKTCFDVALVEALVDSGSVQAKYLILNDSTGKKATILKSCPVGAGTPVDTWEEVVASGAAGDYSDNKVDDTWVMDTASTASSVINNVSGKAFPTTNLCSAFYVVIENDGVTVTKLRDYTKAAGDAVGTIDLTNTTNTSGNLYIDG